MEAGEYGLTHGACFVARRLEVVAVAGLLCISWAVLGAPGFCFVWCLFHFSFFVVFFPSKAQGLLQVRGRLASSTSFLSMGPIFSFTHKNFFNTGVRTGCHSLISLSVCPSACVCITFVVFPDCGSCTRPISTNPGSIEAGEYGLTRGT